METLKHKKMENLKKVIKAVSRKSDSLLYYREDCEDRIADLSHFDDDEETDELYNELTETEREINSLDDDWVFLTDCEEAGKILDEVRYRGIQSNYLTKL